jgi:pSer/pThr/pTyr-binding forkhead associated (FHA) protein
LGRAEGNHYVLDHPSVSDQHCEIRVLTSGVAVKDLGSAGGTFIDEQPVTESLLLPGQILGLGEVRLQLEDTQPVRVSLPAAGPAAAPAVAPSARCKFHPRTAAHFLCPKCQLGFCEMCVNTRIVAGASKSFCRHCAVECAPVEVREEEPVEISFTAQIAGAFQYPFKGDGIILICVGTLLFLLVDGARWISKFALIYGFIAVILLTIFGTGYLTAYLRRVITSTAQGDEEMPEWPEIQDFSGDIFMPFMQFIGAVAFCFAPALGLTIYALTGGAGESAWLGWATTASLVFGCVYFPMAFTAVAMADSVVAVNPLVVIPSIMKVLGQYLLTVVVLALILLIRWLLFRLLETILPIPLLPTIITSLLGLYLLVVEMRILGLLYRTNKDRLGWYTV